MDLCNINDIKALLSRHGFRFSKSMGQNFLIEDWVPRDIADASGAAPGVGVVEVGPGIGPLTRELSLRADKVVSIELDRSLLPILAETLSDHPNAEIFPGDVLKTDLPALVSKKLAGLSPIACANLPYNITTPAITALIEAGCFGSITVMIQREVAKRICAQPGTSDYGAFSIYCQYHAQCELLFEVPPDCFIPAPKVTSAVIQLTPTQQPPVAVSDEGFFFRVVRAAFSMRRKTLANGLANGFSGQLTKGEITELIQSCGFAPTVRGEQLGLAEFARLADAIQGALG